MPYLLFEPPASALIVCGRGRMHWLKPLEHYTIIPPLPTFHFQQKDPYGA